MMFASVHVQLIIVLDVYSSVLKQQSNFKIHDNIYLQVCSEGSF
jgi:hypothetical protein